MKLGRTITIVGAIVVISATLTTSRAADIAIYRAATAGEALTTADFDHTWDTTVRSSAQYTLNANNTDIACSAGHHLVMYSARFDRSNTTASRTEAQGCLVLAGSSPAIGWSQGYTRYDNGDKQLILSGGGIIDVASGGDLLKLRTYRTDSNTGATMARVADACGIQLLKLADTWSYCRLALSADQTGPTSTTFIPVTYDVQDEVDTADFSHTSGSEDITLKTPGHYLVLANTYFTFASGANRTGYNQRLTLGDGATQTYVDGSRTWVYCRGSDGADEGSTSLGMIIETTSADEVLNIEVNKETGINATLKSSGTAVTIVKLPDTGDYVRLDGPADEFNPSTLTAQTWDTHNELDSPTFAHSGSDSTVSVSMTDDYLFTTALFDDDDAQSRAKPWQRWRVNGTDVKTYAGMGRYARNSGTQDCGNWSGFLVGLGSGDTVEVVSEALSSNTGGLSADSKHLTGVRLGSIFSSAPVTILNQTESNVGSTTATLNGLLLAESTNSTVTVYWGTTDGTNNPLAWAESQIVGSWTNVASTNVSYDATLLSSGTTYYYTFSATLGASNVWASPSVMFDTLSAPAVTNAGGATEVYASTATLNGELTAGVAADAYFCWSTTDQGTSGTGAWDNVVSVGQVLEGVPFSTGISGLTPDSSYVYRCYVVNEVSDDWSTLDSFTTVSKTTYVGPGVGSWDTDTWNTAANWDSGVPVGGMDAVIAADQYASVRDTVTPAYVGDLTIQSNATLEIGQTAEPTSLNVLGGGSITFEPNTVLTLRYTVNSTHPQDFILNGDMRFDIGRSSSAHHEQRFLTGSISGAGKMTVHDTNNQRLFLQGDNSAWSGGMVTGGAESESKNATIEADASNSLGTGEILIGDGNTLYLDGVDATTGSNSVFGVEGTKSANESYKLYMNAADTVGQLKVDGFVHPAGTYGAIGSGADKEMAWITGASLLTVNGDSGDTTAPNVTFATVGFAGSTTDVMVGEPVTCTVTFDEPLAAGPTLSDFENAGSAFITVDSVTAIQELGNMTVLSYSVIVKATSTGTLKLGLKGTTSLEDLYGNTLVVPVADDDTLTVNPAAQIQGEAGVWKPWANGGINPVTGSAWAIGDQYRLIFVTSEDNVQTADTTDLSVYDAYLQGLAAASTTYPDLGNAVWHVVGSSDTVDARDHTGTNPGVDGEGVALFLCDGATKIADNNTDLWNSSVDNTVTVDENGVGGYTWGNVATGTNGGGTKEDRHLGGSDEAPPKVTYGRCTEVSDKWVRVYNGAAASAYPYYALSEPLTLVSGAPSGTKIILK